MAEHSTPCYNPATGELIGESPLDTVESLSTKIADCRTAQLDWGKTSVRERVRRLRPVRRHLVEHADELAEIIVADNGKTITDALATEIVPAAMALHYYGKRAGQFLRSRAIGRGNIMFINKSSQLHRVPLGVVGIISPWNYPFAIPFSEVIMALLAGNGVILKTASETQLVGRALEKCIQAADLPEGLFQYVNMPGRVAGKAFIDQGVDKLFFTGSVPVGRELMARAAEKLIPVVLELGGNDAMIVCEDANVERAVNGAVWAGLQNAGQSCGGVERVYVHEKIAHEFLKRLKAKVESLKVGLGSDFNVDIGAMTTARQVAIVRAHIRQALASGAKIWAQAPLPTGLSPDRFVAPVVLTDVHHDMMVMKEETFGPVLGVMTFNTDEEAIRLANDSELGLTGSVWSKNRPRAQRLAGQIKAGAVTINDHLMSHGLAETPWGGFKQSGLGRTHGQLGFDEMTQPQVVIDDAWHFTKKQLWWHPFSRPVYQGLKGIMNFLYGPGRLSGLLKLVRILGRMLR